MLSPPVWFIPCWSGDFRLEADPKRDDRCVLTVEKPTAADRKRLGPFLAVARVRGWLDEAYGVKPTGKTVLPMKVSLGEAGPLLVQETIGQAEVWTAVRYANGRVVMVDGPKLPVVADEPKAAVSTPPPQRGCPAPWRCNRRASDVLRAFSTASQWASWLAAGSMKVIGCDTGKAYRLFHRDEAALQGLERVLMDVATGYPLCVWDDRVPAEEEVLGIKLALEQRENWLLGFPGMRFGDVVGVLG